MESQCEKLRRLVARGGRATISDLNLLAEHARGCVGCRDYLDALVQLERALLKKPCSSRPFRAQVDLESLI
jgi:hypothetical protein